MRISRALVIMLALVPVSIALAQDAEDAYREARRMLNRQEFDEAIAAFRALRQDYQDSSYASDSYYWEAFALERNGNLELAVERIDQLLREHPDAATVEDAEALRIRVCSELARLGDRQCAELLSSTVRDPDRLDDATRMAAVNALVNMRADRAIPIASQVVANRSHPAAVRRHALFILADKAKDSGNESIAREILRDVALDETDDREVREQAVFWLSEVPGEDTLDLLAQIIDRSTDRQLRNRAIFAISQHDDPQALELLRQYAENESFDIPLRKQAIFWIGEEGRERSLPFLTALYSTLTNSELRQQVLFAVSETGAQGSKDWLLQRASDSGELIGVRKQALFWAAEAGITIEELSGLYESTSERELREHLIWLISDHGGEGSLESLLNIARNDPDVAMRSKAVFWIGDSDDPRAADYLLELLER